MENGSYIETLATYSTFDLIFLSVLIKTSMVLICSTDINKAVFEIGMLSHFWGRQHKKEIYYVVEKIFSNNDDDNYS